ncbi:WD40 repeat-like protein [Daedalea quercina L-15889]|uniref:WD40 repeat-like protein n=1 Tax=Daedalea quercina L-15889 TaxID=1314783 RepID=A0A165UFM6_9APHY|nr:WD40 repeat-like protein [Daedalea quercina L-15889]
MIEGTSLSVHRCRFVDFSPSAITALAFPPLRLPSVKGKKSAASSGRKALRPGTLAVGRSNGNIEIYEWTGSERKVQAPQAWVVRKTIPGPHPSKVDCLAFSIKNPDHVGEDEVPALANLRLFSAGGSSELVEWDFDRACIRRTLSSQGGSIWAVTPNPAGTQLALGCEDGSIRLISIEYDTLTHLRRFDRIKSRILSIAWGPPVPRETGKISENSAEGSDEDDEDEDDWSDAWLVAGCSDSSLRKWDVGTGRVLDRMATEKVKGERTLVWAVGVLGDGTIVSGDSMGIVKFWDPVTCTQTDSFPGHAADILCMTISPDGTAVYTSGVDQKITQFTHVKITNPDSKSILKRSSSRWIMSASRRMHSHDVRALAIWPPHTALPPTYRRQFPIDVAPILASGGLDMSVNVTPAALPSATITIITNPLATSTEATFEDSYNRRLAYSSGPFNVSAIHLARQARLLLCMRDTSLTVWRVLQRRDPNSLDMENLDLDDEKPDGGFERILDMDLNVHTNLVASAISDDGRWIAVSDWYETKLFELKQESNGDLTPRRIRDFSAILHSQLPDKTQSAGASSLIFSPDSSKLVITTAMSSYIVIFDLGRGSAPRSPVVLRRFDQHRAADTTVGGRVIKGNGRMRQHSEVQEDTAVPPADAGDLQDGDASEDESSSAEDDTSPNNAVPTVTRMAASPDGQWLVTTDTHGRTFIFNLDSVTYHATLPSFASAIHALAFDTASPNTLVMGLADNTLEVYDVETRSFPRWAQRVVKHMPDKFTLMHDPIIGVTFDPGAMAAPSNEDASGQGEDSAASKSLPPRNALFWGSTWLCRIKLDATPGPTAFDKRRRRDQFGSKRSDHASYSAVNPSAPGVEDGEMEKRQRNFTLVTKYRPLLFADFVAPKELVVVERPLVDVLHGLPPAFFKPKYGRT